MLFRFPSDSEANEQVLLCAYAIEQNGCDFLPGGVYPSVVLEFWNREPETWSSVVRPGADFVVWYGGDVGAGKVRRLLP